MSRSQKNKIASIHLNDATHQAIKKWAEYQGTTMPKLAQVLLEQMQPMLEQLTQTYEEILEGTDQTEALNKLLINGVALANAQLKEDNDVTDNGQSD